MIDRKNGWYRVQFGDWQCAYWEDDAWQILGVDDDVLDEELDNIGEIIDMPPEQTSETP